jgi:hypothetical protein
METLRLDMETWTWRHEMETMTWRYGHGDMGMETCTWRHAHRDMDIETWQMENRKWKPRRFSLICLLFAHRVNGSLSFVRWSTKKQMEAILLQTDLMD